MILLYVMERYCDLYQSAPLFAGTALPKMRGRTSKLAPKTNHSSEGVFIGEQPTGAMIEIELAYFQIRAIITEDCDQPLSQEPSASWYSDWRLSRGISHSQASLNPHRMAVRDRAQL